ncbi:MAG TPA: hypothetical protein VE993_12205, partial [Stellaceae bacterium]|nr:hypothetical protein [Stellaceae bacterium]
RAPGARSRSTRGGAARRKAGKPPEEAARQEAAPAEARTEAIAAQAIGGKDKKATSDIAQQEAEKPPQEAMRQAATPTGSRASPAEIATEAVGERVEGAYADAAKDAERPREAAARRAAMPAGGPADAVPAVGREAARTISRRFEDQPLLIALAGFVLGYVAAFLLHRHR